jgi:hypothetical protein
VEQQVLEAIREYRRGVTAEELARDLEEPVEAVASALAKLKKARSVCGPSGCRSKPKYFPRG